ncbi:hypothetical protein PHMEG_0001130 [Phytophthora megakarya]|uniref:Uncharacterized protein n=1 Tax=Phytophthora megakarya TaxID=4795 RepID=A0A225X1W6_9STRA|nr:hypothetical protein PHMEG_0001130 [Phytophthora megakarya]
MFAANRAIYNKLVARSREDRLGIASDEKMTLTELVKKCRSETPRSKAAKSSLALFFAKKRRDEKTTFLDMKFKSKFSPSNTIEIRKRSVNTVEKDG